MYPFINHASIGATSSSTSNVSRGGLSELQVRREGSTRKGGDANGSGGRTGGTDIWSLWREWTNEWWWGEREWIGVIQLMKGWSIRLIDEQPTLKAFIKKQMTIINLSIHPSNPLPWWTPWLLAPLLPHSCLVVRLHCRSLIQAHHSC